MTMPRAGSHRRRAVPGANIKKPRTHELTPQSWTGYDG
ncbi:hypothetical protein BDI4_1310012 [Burkholderia diffusa]|nr:hypothetical protein BDI4_1310012 [Burkholderia diffusa]